ncbi:IclR family transcriptional regulator C-terminal domain-containing protein [uncultured Tistrella sp.]|uniref:IclR family transcriptional regulator domain-containing protein n=1 Tax=Tistrella mobilis TaxID=171437 RepID=UPI000C098703|nr:IclR family transcriptional regulator C-terminal domain-containing protein [uncultured Tistrella sp.]MAM74693.1 IclR family transcriptional regulator [Tistrella sp.]
MIDPDSPDFVASFARGLSVVRAFGAEAPRQTLSEVAERTGLTRAAARRFLLTLEALGYARSDGKYFELTPMVLELGFSYLSSLDMTEAIQPWLRRVSDTLGESCSAAVLDGIDIIYVARAAARHRILAISLNVGARLPAWCTSMGQVLLANLPPARRNMLLRDISFEPRTPHSLGDMKSLGDRLALVRDQGYAIADQELELGLRSIAVPLHDRTGVVVAAMNVSAQAARVSVEMLEREYLPVLLDAARQFEATERVRG